MNIEEQLRELSRQTYPKQVDVVDRVMSQVRQMPAPEKVLPLATHRTRPLWPRLAVSSAAAVVALVVINLTLFRSSYDTDSIGSTMAYVSDYSYYSPVESAAENPIGYLYDDLY